MRPITWLPQPRGSGPRHYQRGQSIVEFGLVVLLFVLLISGIFDFGVLLNARLSISSLSRILARAAAADAPTAELTVLANQQERIVGVTTEGFAKYCCDVGDAVEVKISYYDVNCSTNCSPRASRNDRLVGDRVVVDVNARGTEVLTLLVRPAFGCTDGRVRHCLVPVSAQTTMRLEGKYP